MPAQRHLPFCFELAERTVPTMLRLQAERFGDKRLLVCGAEAWSYRGAADHVARMAGTLRVAGIVPGDRIALMCGNRAENLALFLAAGWIGAVTVPINTASKGPQIEYYLRNSDAKLFVVEAEYLPLLDHADLSGLPLERIWTIGTSPAASVQRLPCAPLPPPARTVAPAQVGPGDTLAILYTSGTTGPSKGVQCPHAQYFWWGAHTSRLLGVVGADVLHTTLPLFHINALNTFAQALLTGATQIIAPRFSASGFWKSLVASDASVTYLLGAMVPILMSNPPTPEERAHRVRVALGPGVPWPMHAAFRERTGIVLLEGYGSTETNFVIADPIDRPRANHMGHIGPGFGACVVDESGNEVAPGVAGELLLRTDEPFAFATGYHGMPEKSAEAFRDGWFHTGDRVTRDADGAFRFVDRLKDAIRRRGENISSFEVEQVLLSHPDVKAAAVFPVRSALAEDEVMAALVRKPGSNPSEADLIRFCEPRLPYFAIPSFLEFLDDLPRTENGKIQKFQLRERGVVATTWSREAAGIQVKRR
jgi:carnitine-CoA ligase